MPLGEFVGRLPHMFCVHDVHVRRRVLEPTSRRSLLLWEQMTKLFMIDERVHGRSIRHHFVVCNVINSLSGSHVLALDAAQKRQHVIGLHTL
jgi:hypothetical protein